MICLLVDVVRFCHGPEHRSGFPLLLIEGVWRYYDGQPTSQKILFRSIQAGFRPLTHAFLSINFYTKSISAVSYKLECPLLKRGQERKKEVLLIKSILVDND